MNNWKEKLEKREFSATGIAEVLKYRIYIPENISGKLPVLLFLHGAGERGSDNERQLNVGLMHHYFEGDGVEKYPAIVIAPQCPDGQRWAETDWDKGSYDLDAVGESDTLKLVDLLLSEVCEKYNADKDRVYVTGISMGGYGTWNMIMHHPEKFAAALPICGGADPRQAEKIKHIPIMTFHADDDRVVPPVSTRETVAALKEAGGNILYTEYRNGLGHGCWDAAYSDKNTIPWLFSHKKK